MGYCWRLNLNFMLGAKLGITSKQYNIVTDGLEVNYIPGFKKSYPGTGDDIFNLASGSLTPTGSLENNGTNLSFTPTSGDDAGYFTYDGTDDYVDCGQISALKGTAAFTISGWYKQTTLDQQRFLWGTYTSGVNMISCETWSDGKMYIELRNGSTSYMYHNNYSDFITADEWFHIAVVFDGSGGANADRWKLYIGGALIEMAYNGTMPATSNATQGNFLIANNSNWNVEWLGDIGPIMIYNKALSTSEILQNYNASKDRYA